MVFRYLIAGGTAAAFDLTFFLVFSSWLGYHYLLIGAIGFLLATAINYEISIRVVFRSGARFAKHQEIGAVYLVSGIGLLLHELVLYLMVAGFSLPGIAGKVIATGSIFFWNYGLRKYVVFREA